MKPTRTLLVLALVSSIGMVGCGSNNQAAATQSSSAQVSNNSTQVTSQDTSKQVASSSIKSGVMKMITISADLKKAIDSGDEAKVKTTGPQLEEAWHTFEDDVKTKYPDSYKKVEESLDPTVAGSKATPLNKDVLGKLNDQLAQALNEISGKEK